MGGNERNDKRTKERKIRGKEKVVGEEDEKRCEKKERRGMER